MADQTTTPEEQAQEAVGAARRWGRQTLMHAMASRARRTGQNIDDQWVREAGEIAMSHDESTWREALRLCTPEAGNFDQAIATYIDAVLGWTSEQLSDLAKP